MREDAGVSSLILLHLHPKTIVVIVFYSVAKPLRSLHRLPEVAVLRAQTFDL